MIFVAGIDPGAVIQEQHRHRRSPRTMQGRPPIHPPCIDQQSVHCHYTGHGTSLAGAKGKLKPGVAEARARGVILDLGHGLGSFNFAEARKCLDAGFPVDTISSDIYQRNIEGPVYDMPTTMSKLLYLGMSFDDALLRSTANPAKVIGRVEGLGTLRIGAPGDVALLAIEDGQFRLVDSQRNAVTAKQRIACRLTICRGKRVLVPL